MNVKRKSPSSMIFTGICLPHPCFEDGHKLQKNCVCLPTTKELCKVTFKFQFFVFA